MSGNRGELLVDRLVSLSRCPSYAVLVVDTETLEVDAYGPYDGLGATVAADRFRIELDAEGLREVIVGVSRLHGPADSGTRRTTGEPSGHPWPPGSLRPPTIDDA